MSWTPKTPPGACPFCGHVGIGHTINEDAILLGFCLKCHATVEAGESTVMDDDALDQEGLAPEDHAAIDAAWNARALADQEGAAEFLRELLEKGQWYPSAIELDPFDSKSDGEDLQRRARELVYAPVRARDRTPLDLGAYMVPGSIEAKWDDYCLEIGITDTVTAANARDFARRCCRQMQADFRAQARPDAPDGWPDGHEPDFDKPLAPCAVCGGKMFASKKWPHLTAIHQTRNEVCAAAEHPRWDPPIHANRLRHDKLSAVGQAEDDGLDRSSWPAYCASLRTKGIITPEMDMQLGIAVGKYLEAHRERGNPLYDERLILLRVLAQAIGGHGDECRTLDHKFMSAYEEACDWAVAIGLAEHTDTGAILKADPFEDA